jgi:hypothetical protein
MRHLDFWTFLENLLQRQMFPLERSKGHLGLKLRVFCLGGS